MITCTRSIGSAASAFASSPAANHRDAGTRFRQQARRRARGGDRDVRLQTAIGQRTPELARRWHAHRRTGARARAGPPPGRSGRPTPRAAKTAAPRRAARAPAIRPWRPSRSDGGRQTFAARCRAEIDRARGRAHTRLHVRIDGQPAESTRTGYITRPDTPARSWHGGPRDDERVPAGQDLIAEGRRGRGREPCQRGDGRGSSRTEAPPALRASGRSAISTQAVSLAAISRCSRSHVVNGSSAQHPPRDIGQVQHHDAEPARTEHERGGLERARDGPPDGRQGTAPASRGRLPYRIQRRLHSGDILATDPQQPLEDDARGDGRGHVESIERIDAGRQLAACRRAGERARAPAQCVPWIRAPVSSEICPRAMPPQSDRSSASCPIGTARSTRSGAAGGRAVVSVVSSLRARSRDSSAARATAGAIYAPPLLSLYFRYFDGVCQPRALLFSGQIRLATARQAQRPTIRPARTRRP